MSSFCQAKSKLIDVMTSTVVATTLLVAVADVVVVVGLGTTMACVSVAFDAGVETHIQRPSVPLSTTLASAAVAPAGVTSTQGAGGVVRAVVPKLPCDTRLEVDVAVPTETAGPEFRSTIGADAKMALMVEVSTSVNAPPVPILPRSLVVIVKVMVPPATAL